MRGDAQVNETVALLYEAALDPTRWPEALGKVQDMAGAAGIAYHAGDASDAFSLFSRSVGVVTADLIEVYKTSFASIDPRREIFDRVPGRIVSFDEHFDDTFVRQSAFYNNFLLPLGIRHCLGGCLYRTPTLSVSLHVGRSPRQGPFTADDRRFIEAVVPHLVNIARLQQALPRPIEATAGSVILERIGEGMLVIDGAGRVLWMNPAAEEIVAATDGIAVRAGVLCAARSFETATLHQRLHAAFLAAAGQSGDASGGGLLVGRPSGRQPYALIILPLKPEMAPERRSDPAVLVCIRDSARDVERLTTRVGELFGLTTAELRLAAALMQGDSLAGIAAKLGRRMPTLRTQMRELLKKTGTRRQADLVRTLLSIPTLR